MAEWIKENFDFNDVQRILLKLIERVDAFEGLSQTDAALLLEISEKCRFDPGSTIVREGGTGSYLYVIIDGSVSVVKGGRAGGGTELAKLGPGESFGEISLADGGTRTASVIALAPCVMLRLSEKNLNTQPGLSAKVYRNLARILARRVRKLDEAYVLNRR